MSFWSHLVNWSIDHNCFIGFCWKTVYVVCSINSLTLASWPTAVQFMSEQSSSNTCIFSARHVVDFLCLGTLDSTWTLCLGGISDNKIPRTMKNVTLNRPWKGDLCTVWELKPEGTVASGWALAGCVHCAAQIFCWTVHVCKWPRRCLKDWFWSCKYILERQSLIRKYEICE